MKVSSFTQRITIERLRTVVLIGGGILIAAIAIFLAAGQWKLRKLARDIPGKLGVDIQQSANGIDYTQSRKGKTLFKLHAAKAVQIKSSGKSLLHDVHIDLYGEDGKRADTIAGSDFEYDPAAGIAHAAGTVEITMMRPGARPAIAQLKPGIKPRPQQANQTPATNSAITDNEVHVTTSGLTFNQKSGVATTDQRVDFAVRQGKGNAIGAVYDSQSGELTLDHSVVLVASAQATHTAGEVTVHASHAQFERDDKLCILNQAKAEYTGGNAQAALAHLTFRDDGTVERMEGSGGVDLLSASGAHITAPRGRLDFDDKNRPRVGDLTGGMRLLMHREEPGSGGRDIDGTAPSAHMIFDGKGELHQAHLERGVLFHTHQKTVNAKGAQVESDRRWSSATADIDFAHSETSAKKEGAPSTGGGRVEPRQIRGNVSVVIDSQTTTAGHTVPAKLSADAVVAELAPGSVLTHLTGTGHAHFEQQTAQGAHQTSSSDQLDVHFTPATGKATALSSSGAQAVEIETMHQSGHVILTQTPAPKPGSSTDQAPMHATSDTSDYDGKSEVLHLTGSPRVQQGSLDLTAQSIDFKRATGDALARGDVRASFMNTSEKGSSALPGASLLATAPAPANSSTSRDNGPVHAIAAEAELRQSTQEIFLRAGQGSATHARLWQGGNSVSAPLIILNRQKQTLVAQSSSSAGPVRTVILSNPPAPKSGAKAESTGKAPQTPSILRVRSGDLRYSEAERLALFHAGTLGNVTTETSENGSPATIVAQQAEVHLAPAGAHGSRPPSGTASVERMTAQGHVTVDFPDRHGTGDQLVYLGDAGTFTLTGTGANPPTMTDTEQGTVTGAALVYHNRDRSVSVEGQGAKTLTETHTPKK